MNIPLTEYAKRSKIPNRVLRHLKDKGFIHDPLNREDCSGLNLLEKIWCNREVLRSQLVKFSMKDRQRFIKTTDLPSKWERYAYSRFRDNGTGKSLPMRTVIREIENTFGFQPDEAAIRRLHNVRNRAQVDRHRERVLTKRRQETSYRAQTKK